MARSHIRTLGRRINKNYSEENLQKALHKITKCGWTLRDTAACYGIPKSTLSDYKQNAHPLKYGHPTALKPAEEENLVRAIILASK